MTCEPASVGTVAIARSASISPGGMTRWGCAHPKPQEARPTEELAPMFVTL
jgi:hypothetical protein